jgi:tripartite-type tricarboxylate transporter receptor subunit TctC
MRIYFSSCSWARLLTAISFVFFTASCFGQQPFPDRPIRIVVGFPPGGFADVLMRMLTPKMSESLGQQVIVDNRPGASGTIAVGLVAKSPPDGYTLICGSPTTIVVAPYAYRNLPYDPLKLQPISRVAVIPSVLVTHPSVSATTVGELIRLAKSQPGKLAYGSGGNGTTYHLAAELFSLMTGSELLHVPYKGSAPAVADLVSGQISMLFEPINTALPLVRSGRAKGLAVTSLTRINSLPDLPTVAETVPEYEMSFWLGLLAPADTPKHIVDRLYSEVSRLLRAGEIRDRLTAQGIDPIGDRPEDFAKVMHRESIQWADFVKRTGLSLN